MKLWRNIIVITLVITGILFIGTPFIKNYIINHNMNNSLNEMEELDSNELAANRKNKEYSEEVTELPSNVDVFKSLKFEGNPVAFLYLPRTGLKLPIYGSVNNTNLLHGAGEMKDYSELGKGNYAIAGHRMKEEGLLFHDIPRLKKGDVIYVTDKETIYEYKLYDPEIVYEDETDLINDRDKDEITLLTCDVPSKPHNRVKVNGDLINTYSYTNDFFD
ncbi:MULTISPECIES: class A sortase [Allobacillus]|uniref:Class A sortase n=1 Tax=Allobacillus salarius TaxID=1955272 RepID=A0A556PGT3_9BACI|nr:class A sortase [Allobacillus salarius]TSJ63575.1 class A sortase [Allobacillus salarius]